MWCHRRQFIIGPRALAPLPGWITTPIQGVGYLSYAPELRVATVTDTRGVTWFLLGLVVQTDGTGADPVDELARPGRGSVHEVCQSWAGRWVLIGDGKLYTDSAALLGCFYGRGLSSERNGELWISSSAGLLAGVLDRNTAPLRSIHHEIGIDWYTPPFSRYASIRRLLPSQALDLCRGDVTPRRLIPQAPENLTYDNLLCRMEACLTTALRNVAALSTTLWLPLTGGYDSRLLLAAALHAGVRVRTFTLGSHGMSDADRLLPPRLARAAGVSHAFDWGRGFVGSLEDTYDLHTGGHCDDRDRYLIPHGYYSAYSLGDIVLRGGCFELGRCFYWNRFPVPDTETLMPDVRTILKGFHKLRLHKDHALTDALQEWVSWCRQTPHHEMDWRDRLYLEQRLAGWLSSIEQALDLVDATSFFAANSQLYFMYALQVSLEKRRASQHQVDLIARMAPQLLALPFNPPDRARRRVVAGVKGRVRFYVQALLS